MTGIGLPLTFAAGARSATMFMRPSELIPLYATEWAIFAVMGLAVAGISAVLDLIAASQHRGIEHRVCARVSFAVVVTVAVVFAAEAWFTSFGSSGISSETRHYFLLVAALVVGLGTAWGLCREILNRLARLARPIAMLGALALVSLAFIREPSGTGAAKSAQVAAGAAQRPNIVLISCDALAASHLQPYGSQRPTSPNIAAFASHGIVFERFHANSNFTTPSIATILTGVPPWTHRALQLPGRPSVESVRDSLPARLHAAGYTTAYFGSNPWAGARRQGFSAFFDYAKFGLEWGAAPCFDALSNVLTYLCAASLNPMIELPFKLGAETANTLGLIDLSKNSDPARTVEEVDRWTKIRGGAPIFMWIHFLPPHDPYAAPAPWLGPGR